MDVGQSKAVSLDLSLAADHIRSSQTLYRYTGSVTYPDCKEGVHWLVAHKPFLLTLNDFLDWKQRLGNNARPPQPVAEVHDPNGVTSRKSTYFPEI